MTEVSLIERRSTGRLLPSTPRQPVADFGLKVTDDGRPMYYTARGRLASDLEFLRASTGVAMAGGASGTFATDVPRTLDGRLFMDAGGTNLVPHPTDFSHADWTKNDLGAPALTTGPGGANTAYAIRETATTADHYLIQAISGVTSHTRVTFQYLLKMVGRDYLEFAFQNESTSKVVVARANMLTGSVLSPYPVGTGGTTGVDGGVVPYGDGWYLLWLTGLWPGAETGFRPYLQPMLDSSTSNYAGDTSKGFDLAGIWAIAGSAAPVNLLTGTRAAETFNVPLNPGAYIGRRVDAIGTALAPFEIASEGDTWSVAPRDGGLWLEEAQAYSLALYDDTSLQSDSAHGATITPTYGPALIPYKYPDSFPMVAATNGRVRNGKFEIDPQSGANGTTYWRSLLGDAKTMQARLYFDAATVGGDTQTNMSFCMAFCQRGLDSLTEEMVGHIVFTEEGFSAQYRTIGAGFDTRAQLQRNYGGEAYTDVLVTFHGDKVSVTMWGITVTTQHPQFVAFDPTSVFFELQSRSNNTVNTLRFAFPGAGPLSVGPEPEYVATVPVNIANATHPNAAGTATAGSLFTRVQGYWSSNDGEMTFANRWQFDTVTIDGATDPTYQTINGVDEGKKLRFGELPTNDSGPAAAYVFGPESAALA